MLGDRGEGDKICMVNIEPYMGNITFALTSHGDDAIPDLISAISCWQKYEDLPGSERPPRMWINLIGVLIAIIIGLIWSCDRQS